MRRDHWPSLGCNTGQFHFRCHWPSVTLFWTMLPKEAVKGGVKSSFGGWFWQLIRELYKWASVFRKHLKSGTASLGRLVLLGWCTADRIWATWASEWDVGLRTTDLSAFPWFCCCTIHLDQILSVYLLPFFLVYLDLSPSGYDLPVVSSPYYALQDLRCGLTILL